MIERKRDGAELTTAEIQEFVQGFTSGEIPEYQASAWAMAVFFRGLNSRETGDLTGAMMRSGRVLAYPPHSPPKVDKHSTGGIGDKTSLILAPLLACDELWVPMISGRGLGITGGTLDKLESIPGFNVNLSEPEALGQLERIGLFMIGQTADICPADKKLYALRDVTGTVPSQALIAASIMSKKLAESLDRLVLDVKFGSGAFMQTRSDAESLAASLVATGNEMGVQMSHLLTPMDQPLGAAAGNALEVIEAVECLQGRGPADTVALTLDLAECVANVPRSQLERWLNDGTAWRKFVALIEAQGGDAVAAERLGEVHRAPVIEDLPAPHAGTLMSIDAGRIGRACVQLGAGRAKASDAIDFAVGCSAIQKVGAAVQKGEPLLRIHARTQPSLEAALPLFQEAIRVQ
ncbi:MAG: thymidine phosphorylase [Chthoniobacter sp.]|nr:thymidine phosphorylase [Chthoniobacter sp.]